MSNNDNQSDDKELKSYLDGRDGVSAAYKHTATETPGQELDALILQAAHAAVASKPRQERTQLRGLFSLAASLIVGVMIGAVSMGYLDLGSPGAEFAVEDSVAVSAPTTNETTLLEAAVTNAPEADNADPASQEQAAKSEDAASTTVANSQRLNLAQQLTAPSLRRQSDTVDVQQAMAPVPATAPLPVPATAAGPAPPALASTTALTPATIRLATTTQPAQQASAELEEIVVTGARITRRDFSAASPIITITDPNTAPWRATSTTWLQHIADLHSAQSARLIELDAADQELSVEEELFRLAWPDVPMEEALEQLKEGRQ